MHTLLLGDSHTVIFRSQPNTMAVECLTAKYFIEYCIDPNYPKNKYSVETKGSTLLVCLNEVDIRGHYWKHAPHEYAANNVDISAYIMGKARELYNAINTVRERCEFETVILWGPPPACDNMQNNAHWPFRGSVVTRNIMTHLFNKAFTTLTNSNIKFATGFYDYIGEDYMPAPNHIHTDGVHWTSALSNTFWNIIQSKENYPSDINNNDKFEFNTITKVKSNRLYDSWIESSCIQNPNPNERSIVLDDKTFILSSCESNHVLQDEYEELCLSKKVPLDIVDFLVITY